MKIDIAARRLVLQVTRRIRVEVSNAMATAPVSNQISEASGSPFRRELDFLWRMAEIPTDSQEARWERFIRLADQHGLVPLLYETAPGAAPPKFQDNIFRGFDAHARQALWLTTELVRILQCLESAGVEALAHKGPALAQFLYGDVARRQFSDLDILVRARDVARAKQVLHEMGYAIGLELSPAEERAYLASGYELAFDGQGGRNLVELQWRILPRFYAIDFDMEGLFRRATVLPLGGRQVRTLCAEDLLLALCVHAAKHMWVQISWLADFAALVRKSLDWDFVRKQARALGIQRIMAVTFLLAETVCGMKLAELNFPMDSEARCISREVLGLIESGGEYDTESLHYFRTMIRIRERWRDRLRFLRRLVFTPSVSEWRMVRLPGALFPLYRGVRMVRLIGRLAA